MNCETVKAIVREGMILPNIGRYCPISPVIFQLSHASTFSLYCKYLIFKFTYLNTFNMYNMEPMGLLGDIKFFYLDEMFHELTSHHTDVPFYYICTLLESFSCCISHSFIESLSNFAIC